MWNIGVYIKNNYKETKIHREEVYQAIQDQNTEAAQSTPSDLARLNEALKEK